MFAAQQRKLFQDVNQEVVSIRKAELDYLVRIKKGYGFRASLLGGFTFKIYTLAKSNDYTWARYATSMYYIFTGITIAASVHVILVAFFLQSLAPGLALNGPVGSIVRAIDVMYSELDQVHKSFTILVISFWITTMSAFWAIMDFTAACICTFIFLIGIPISYHYLSRAYVRFGWSPFDPNQRMKFNEVIAGEHDISYRFPSNEPIKEPLLTTNNAGLRYRFFSWFFDLPDSKPLNQNDSKSGDSPVPTEGTLKYAGTMSKDRKRVVMEGYLIKKAGNNDLITGEKWDRRYFVMNAKGYLHYYKNRPEYKKNPETAIKDRPLELRDFNISARRDLSVNPPILEFALQPKQDQSLRVWYLRTDTEEEMSEWISAFQDTCPESCLMLLK